MWRAWAIPDKDSLLLFRCAFPLWMKVHFVDRNFIFVRPTFDARAGGLRSPLERGGLPGARIGDSAAASAAENIPQKDELGRGEQQGGEGDAAFVGGDCGKRCGRT